MSKTGKIPPVLAVLFFREHDDQQSGDLGMVSPKPPGFMAARVGTHNDLQDAGPQVGLQPTPGQSQLQGVQQQVVVHASVGGNDLSDLWGY